MGLSDPSSFASEAPLPSWLATGLLDFIGKGDGMRKG